MTAYDWKPGIILDIDLPPCWGGWGLAGTHPGVVVGRREKTGELCVLALTSSVRRQERTYFLSRDISDLRHDSHVLIEQARWIEPVIWRRARYLSQLPGNILEEIEMAARRTLRRQGLT